MGFPLLDGYIEKYGPGAQELGMTVRAYADRIVARLDCIQAAVERDETWEHVNNYDFYGTVRSTERLSLRTLRTDDRLVLNVFSRSIVLSNMVLTVDNEPRFYANSNSECATQPLIITGPGELELQTDTNSDVALQFKVYQKRTHKHTSRLGFGVEPREIDRLGLAEDYRHMGALNGNSR